MQKRNASYRLLAVLLLAITGFPALSTNAYADSRKTDQGVALNDQGQQHSDAWITTQVKAKLLEQHIRTGLDVKVTTDDGVVKLSGYVKKAKEVTLADKVASSVEGVKRVQNDLTIK
jgi:hyperosmotically inducible protein